MIKNIFKIINFSALIFVFAHNSAFADDFEVMLESLRAEAQAQQSYFKGLSEEYQKEFISMRGKGQLIIQKGGKKMNATKFHQDEAHNSYNLALSSYYFWLALKETVDLVATEYQKIPASDETNKFRLPVVQYALSFLLGQVSRAGVISFTDLTNECDWAIKKQGLKQEDFEASGYDKVFYAYKKVIADNTKNPSSHAHMQIDIDLLAPILRAQFGTTEVYRNFFTDYKSTNAVFNYLKPYYILDTPIPAQYPPVITTEKDKWVDIIIQEIKLREQDYEKMRPSELGKLQSIEEAKLMPALLNPFKPDFRKKVRKTKNKQRIKQKAISSQAALQASVVDMPEEELASPEGVQPLEVVERKGLLVPSFEEKSPDKKSDGDVYEDESLPYMNYTDWVWLQRELSAQVALPAQANAPSTNPALAKIRLTGGARDIYRTAMGSGAASTTTNRDLNDFLRQVGGGFVKCSGRHSDRKIALPNYSPNATDKFLVDKMHLMHSGRDIFPISRLQTHLRRMIDAAGLRDVIELD